MEDLFYNIPSRKRAFKSPSEEYAKILDIVGRYAVHCTGVSFSCKKHGESAMSISTPSNASTIDSIRQIHGSAVANELVEFNTSSDKWGFKASGWATNANYNVKKTTFLLFINHRSVESSAIKKSIEQAYNAFLPKGGHPFVYLSLDIEPQRVDVNVHPTKREVNFLNEDEITGSICNAICTKLSQVDTSRSFLMQTLLPSSNKAPVASLNLKGMHTSAITPNNLIRTDPSLRKITSMLSPNTPSRQSLPQPSKAIHPSSTVYTVQHGAHTTIRLASIRSLRAAVRDQTHAALTEAISMHTYVGLVDPCQRIAAIQSGVKLLLVDYGLLCSGYFYQLGLTDFGNFGAIRFEPALDIKGLIELGVKIEWEETQSRIKNGEVDDADWHEIPEFVTKRLIQSRAMLLEYFNMEISAEGQLISIPLLIKGYTPTMAKLPRFLMRLGPCVNWDDEEECFRTFLQELATFYTVERLPDLAGSKQQASKDQTTSVEKCEIEKRTEEIEHALEHVIFPAFRARLIATTGLLPGVVEAANLKGLYRVFERC